MTAVCLDSHYEFGCDIPGAAYSFHSTNTSAQTFGINVPANLDPEGYVLAVNANEVLVAGKTEAGTFYGLQTLKQLVTAKAHTC